MISTIYELKEVNNYVKSIIKKNNKEGKIPLGMMFEVPSVFIDPMPFLKEIDFGNLGTNDLSQYLFAIDRNNAHVTYLNNENDEILFKLTKNLLKEASRLKIDISLCGEISLRSSFFKKLIESGLRKISISPLGADNIIKEIAMTKL
jgi:phosphoenolpyruvate-protein kinase (PTS system EI component)